MDPPNGQPSTPSSIRRTRSSSQAQRHPYIRGRRQDTTTLSASESTPIRSQSLSHPPLPNLTSAAILNITPGINLPSSGHTSTIQSLGMPLSNTSTGVVRNEGIQQDNKQLDEVLLELKRTNNRLDGIEAQLSSLDNSLRQIRGQVTITRDVRQSLLQDRNTTTPIVTLKDFIDAPNLIARDVHIFKFLKDQTTKLAKIEYNIAQTQAKLTKDEGSMIRNFVKSIFLRLDLKSQVWFDRSKLMVLLTKNCPSGFDSTIFVTKKVDIIRILSECLTEEKSKFRSVLRDSSSRALPICAFTKKLFLAKAYDSGSDDKKEKMQLSAAKWRFVTESIWAASLPTRKWWDLLFANITTLYKDYEQEDNLSLHKSLLEQDIRKYPESNDEQGLDFELEITDGMDTEAQELDLEERFDADASDEDIGSEHVDDFRELPIDPFLEHELGD